MSLLSMLAYEGRICNHVNTGNIQDVLECLGVSMKMLNFFLDESLTPPLRPVHLNIFHAPFLPDLHPCSLLARNTKVIQ